MDWIQQWQSKLNKQNEVAPLVRTGGSRHTGLAALPYRNIHAEKKKCMVDLHRKLFLDDRTQSINGLAHICSATDDIDRINA